MASRSGATVVASFLAGFLAVLSVVGLAVAKPRTSVAVFDGGTPAIQSPAAASPPSSDLISLELWIAADKAAVARPMTALQLTTANAVFTVEIAADRKSVVLNAGPGSTPAAVAIDLSGGDMVHIGFTFGALETFLFVDGSAMQTLTGVTFAPLDPTAPASLSLGGLGFTGRIGSARVWSIGLNEKAMAASRASPDDIAPTGLDASRLVMGQTDRGQLSQPAVPQTGLWHVNGAGASIPVQKKLTGIPSVNHGQFEDDELFLSIFASDRPFAEFAIATNRDPDTLLYLRRSNRGLGSYSVLAANAKEVGLAKFRPSGKFFQVVDIVKGLPLAVGTAFKTLEMPRDGSQIQQYGEAWQVNDKPKNFEHSAIGCYDSARMNMFDFQEHGCQRRFFREPPPDSHRFDTGRNNLTIPWGWQYLNISETRAKSFSALATTSSDVGSAIAGGSGFNFAIGVVNYEHNETVENERQAVRNGKRMRAYHQFVARRHSLVVDAKKMMLDQCFLRDIARVSYGLSGRVPAMPPYFDILDTSGGECDAELDDPLSVAAFVARYGDLYAYAITYGARAVARVDLSAKGVATLARDGTNVSSALEAKLTGSASYAGLSANFADGGGFSSKSSASNSAKVESTGEIQFDDLICVGGSNCSGNQVDVGDNPVPIYLDLRPIADLLGPPYFADPAIVVMARQAVHAAARAVAAPPAVADMPLMRIFDAGINALDCGLTAMTNITPVTQFRQLGLGPFVAGRRFGALTTPIAEMASAIKSMTDAQAALQRACHALALPGSDAQIELVVESGASADVARPASLVALPGEPLSPRLSDMLSGKKLRIMVPMFDAALGGGPDTHPGLYARLRSASDKDAGSDQCAAPCGYGFQDPTLPHSGATVFGPSSPQAFVDDSGPDFVLYPSFEAIDLTTLAKGGATVGHVLGRGGSNIKGLSAPAMAYWAVINLTLSEVEDIARAIGY